MQQSIQNLGPLQYLLGNWSGEKGEDQAPSDDRGVEQNKFREEILFELLNPVRNHEQELFGLRYRTTAYVLGQKVPFHEEVGYWLWDAKEQQVLRCFLVPRGVSVIAGGTADKDATSFELVANSGVETYGICSNKFLDREFKTVKYQLKVTIHDQNCFSYEETSFLKIKNQKELFLHVDKNTLTRIP